MAKIIWSQEAEGDLDGTAEFISKDSPYYAWVVVDKILGMSRLLADQPKAGRVVPEYNEPVLRERFIYNYRLIYRLSSHDVIEIVAVIHGKRLLNLTTSEV